MKLGRCEHNARVRESLNHESASESHYGDCRYERPDVTLEIIKALALGLRHKDTQGRFGRHPHYAKIFAATNNRSTAGVFNREQRTGFWQKVP